MQPNATELKVSPRLATPDEAKRGQRGLMLAQCVGVEGVPSEAAVASFSPSSLGVNETKQSQMSPIFENFTPEALIPSFPRRRSDPFSLEETFA